MRRLLLVFVVLLVLLASPTVVYADPVRATPPGSTRVVFERFDVNETYVVPAGSFLACSFDLQETVSGWMMNRIDLGPDGSLRALATTDHLTYTDEAFGVSVSMDFFSSKFLRGDDAIVTNPDGTITVRQTRVGHLTSSAAGSSIGLFDFVLTIDPSTGQELSFSVLRHAGQIGGFWAGPVDLSAYCSQFTV
jgi:hypothetical protein